MSLLYKFFLYFLFLKGKGKEREIRKIYTVKVSCIIKN